MTCISSSSSSRQGTPEPLQFGDHKGSRPPAGVAWACELLSSPISVWPEPPGLHQPLRSTGQGNDVVPPRWMPSMEYLAFNLCGSAHRAADRRGVDIPRLRRPVRFDGTRPRRAPPRVQRAERATRREANGAASERRARHRRGRQPSEGRHVHHDPPAIGVGRGARRDRLGGGHGDTGTGRAPGPPPPPETRRTLATSTGFRRHPRDSPPADCRFPAARVGIGNNPGVTLFGIVMLGRARPPCASHAWA